MRAALEQNDTNAIRSATEALERAMAEATEREPVGAATGGGGSGGEGPGAGGGGSDEGPSDAVDAEFREV